MVSSIQLVVLQLLCIYTEMCTFNSMLLKLYIIIRVTVHIRTQPLQSALTLVTSQLACFFWNCSNCSRKEWICHTSCQPKHATCPYQAWLGTTYSSPLFLCLYTALATLSASGVALPTYETVKAMYYGRKVIDCSFNYEIYSHTY